MNHEYNSWMINIITKSTEVSFHAIRCNVSAQIKSVVGRFAHCHASLDVLATETIQGGRFGYIIFFWGKGTVSVSKTPVYHKIIQQRIRKLDEFRIILKPYYSKPIIKELNQIVFNTMLCYIRERKRQAAG